MFHPTRGSNVHAFRRKRHSLLRINGPRRPRFRRVSRDQSSAAGSSQVRVPPDLQPNRFVGEPCQPPCLTRPFQSTQGLVLSETVPLCGCCAVSDPTFCLIASFGPAVPRAGHTRASKAAAFCTRTEPPCSTRPCSVSHPTRAVLHPTITVPHPTASVRICCRSARQISNIQAAATGP